MGWPATNQNIVVQGNYFMGGFEAVAFQDWNSITFQNNTVYTNKYLMNFVTAGAPSGYVWDNNTYYGTGVFAYTAQHVPRWLAGLDGLGSPQHFDSEPSGRDLGLCGTQQIRDGPGEYRDLQLESGANGLRGCQQRSCRGNALSGTGCRELLRFPGCQRHLHRNTDNHTDDRIDDRDSQWNCANSAHTHGSAVWGIHSDGTTVIPG